MDLHLQNDIDTENEAKRSGSGEWRGLTFVMGEEVMSERGGRARITGAQRGAELQHSCQPLREEEEEQRRRMKEKEDGRSTREQRREAGYKLRRKRKARKGNMKVAKML